MLGNLLSVWLWGFLTSRANEVSNQPWESGVVGVGFQIYSGGIGWMASFDTFKHPSLET